MTPAEQALFDAALSGAREQEIETRRQAVLAERILPEVQETARALWCAWQDATKAWRSAIANVPTLIVDSWIDEWRAARSAESVKK